jgi:hypothetical protein
LQKNEEAMCKAKENPQSGGVGRGAETARNLGMQVQNLAQVLNGRALRPRKRD